MMQPTLLQSLDLSARRALPAALFPCFVEAKRTVHRDGHLAYDQAYYSAPPEYVGREVWVRAETRLVRLYNLRFEAIAAISGRQRLDQFEGRPTEIGSRRDQHGQARPAA
jgi:hypothetical protein